MQSVAGRTGNVTLAVADVSGAAPAASPALTGVPTAPTASPGTSTTQVATTAFAGNAASAAQSAAIAACPAETTTTIRSLIAGAAEKTIISPSDKIALSDSAASWISNGDLLRTSCRRCICSECRSPYFSRPFRFSYYPATAVRMALTFTGGVAERSPLARHRWQTCLADCQEKGATGIFRPTPVAVDALQDGITSSLLQTQQVLSMPTRTRGGQPQLVGSPTTFAGSPSGRITTPTSEVTAISGINLTPLGNNGEAELKLLLAGDTASGNKFFKIRLGGTASLSSVPSSSPQEERLMTLRNAGSQSSQILSQATRGTGVAGNTIATSGFTSIDLSGPTTAITMCMQLTANTGCMVLLSSSFTQKYRP